MNLNNVWVTEGEILLHRTDLQTSSASNRRYELLLASDLARWVSRSFCVIITSVGVPRYCGTAYRLAGLHRHLETGPSVLRIFESTYVNCIGSLWKIDIQRLKTTVINMDCAVVLNLCCNSGQACSRFAPDLSCVQLKRWHEPKLKRWHEPT